MVEHNPVTRLGTSSQGYSFIQRVTPELWRSRR